MVVNGALFAFPHPLQTTTEISGKKKKLLIHHEQKGRAVNLKYGDRDDPASGPAFLLHQVKRTTFQEPNNHLRKKLHTRFN